MDSCCVSCQRKKLGYLTEPVRMFLSCGSVQAAFVWLDNSNLLMKDVQFWICFWIWFLLHLAISYSCPLKGEPAAPLDLFILYWCRPSPAGHFHDTGYNFQLHCHTTSVSGFILSSSLAEGERDKSLLLPEHSLTSFTHPLSHSPYLEKQTQTRKRQNNIYTVWDIIFWDTIWDFTAPVRYTCTPVPAIAHLKTGSRNKQTPFSLQDIQLS